MSLARVESDARAAWDAHPHLAYVHADFGAFLQACRVQRLQALSGCGRTIQDLAAIEVEQRSLALARMQSIRKPAGGPQSPIFDRHGTRLVVWLYGPIGGQGETVDSGAIVDALKENEDAQAVILRIASAGGYVDASLAIANALMQHRGRVLAIVDKFAYSGATIVASASHRVLMRRDAAWMMHQGWQCFSGNADDFVARASQLRAQDAGLLRHYRARRRIDARSLYHLFTSGRYLSATEALEAGVCDAIIPPLPNADWDSPLP